MTRVAADTTTTKSPEFDDDKRSDDVVRRLRRHHLLPQTYTHNLHRSINQDHSMDLRSMFKCHPMQPMGCFWGIWMIRTLLLCISPAKKSTCRAAFDDEMWGVAASTSQQYTFQTLARVGFFTISRWLLQVLKAIDGRIWQNLKLALWLEWFVGHWGHYLFFSVDARDDDSLIFNRGYPTLDQVASNDRNANIVRKCFKTGGHVALTRAQPSVTRQ